ncbi:MAG: hypothetical protein H7138_21815 [Myxococcales bacterium]|nr:hypothetical protein [Myxococcales bacterium]
MLPSTAPGTQPVSPLRALPARVEEAPPILVPLAVGTIFGAAGIYFGGKLGIAAADEQSLTSVFVIGLGGLVGGTVAVTVGVMATAGDDVHQSSTAATWGGSVLGGVAGVAFAVAATNDLTSAIFVTAGGSALGALIGHQLSRTRRNPPPTLRLAPLVTTHATGLAVGGHF